MNLANFSPVIDHFTCRLLFTLTDSYIEDDNLATLLGLLADDMLLVCDNVCVCVIIHGGSGTDLK